MNTKVDVLGVLDDMASTVQLVSDEHKSWHRRITDARAAVAELMGAGNRVTAAFRALGTTKDFTAEILARRECEASMLELDAALKAVDGAA